MIAHHSWLPAAARLPASLAVALDERVDAWSRHWFDDGHIRVEGDFAPGGACPFDGKDSVWAAAAGALVVATSPADIVAIGRRVVDLADGGDCSETDDRLIATVAAESIADLGERIANWLGVSPDDVPTAVRTDPSPKPARSVTIRDTANFTIAVGLSETQFVELTKRALRDDRTDQPLGSFATAIASHPVTLAAEVGRCAVTLDEIDDLAIGDVLVLDRLLDASLPLVVGGGTEPAGYCTVLHDADRVALKITKPLVTA